MDETWNELSRTFQRTPPSMLRGMQCSGMRWPFASVDSTDVAQNHTAEHRVCDGRSLGCTAVPGQMDDTAHGADGAYDGWLDAAHCHQLQPVSRHRRR